MPDFYADGEYDLSGFAVGIVKQDSVIKGKDIVVGDDLMGMPSSGVHSNGFSLVRKCYFQEVFARIVIIVIKRLQQM
jgi:phosphoribosylformylglycinamidine cyclo-ligase